jgi:hypothetical protein
MAKIKCEKKDFMTIRNNTQISTHAPIGTSPTEGKPRQANVDKNVENQIKCDASFLSIRRKMSTERFIAR